MIIAILQARLSSSRLPGKVLRLILGKPMLELQIERLSRVTLVDRLIVATSDEASDDPIAELCQRLGYGCFRGSLTDVLDRYYQAARIYRAQTVVRLTGDCPLTDPEVVDHGINYFLAHDYDYVTNCIERTYPIGLDMEVFRFTALEQSWRTAVLPSEREHVTPYMRNHPELFAVGNFKNEIDLSHHRWTVDEPADFEFVQKIYESLYPGNPRFATNHILDLIHERPELAEINYHIAHGQGYQKSLREDELLKKKPG